MTDGCQVSAATANRVSGVSAGVEVAEVVEREPTGGARVGRDEIFDSQEVQSPPVGCPGCKCVGCFR